MFIDSIEKVLRAIFQLEEDQDLAYIVSIFETMIVDHALKRDIFDLSAMRNILISEEQAAKMNITESLSGTTILDLERISDPKVKSKHIIICITGFL